MRTYNFGTKQTSVGGQFRPDTKDCRTNKTKNDSDNQTLSGVGGGEVGELADLLMALKEAKYDWKAQQKLRN